MQYRSRAAAPASPSALASMTPSARSSASYSASSAHSDGASSSSLIYHSEEEPEDFGDPDVLAHDICDFFGGIPAPKKPKKVKAPKPPKQKPVKAHVVDLPLDATATGAQPRESTSRLRRLCKAIVPVSSFILASKRSDAHCSHVQSSSKA